MAVALVVGALACGDGAQPETEDSDEFVTAEGRDAGNLDEGGDSRTGSTSSSGAESGSSDGDLSATSETVPGEVTIGTESQGDDTGPSGSTSLDDAGDSGVSSASDTDTTDETGGQVDPIECPPPLVRCNDRCVDGRADPGYCGLVDPEAPECGGGGGDDEARVDGCYIGEICRDAQCVQAVQWQTSTPLVSGGEVQTLWQSPQFASDAQGNVLSAWLAPHGGLDYRRWRVDLPQWAATVRFSLADPGSQLVDYDIIATGDGEYLLGALIFDGVGPRVAVYRVDDTQAEFSHQFEVVPQDLVGMPSGFALHDAGEGNLVMLWRSRSEGGRPEIWGVQYEAETERVLGPSPVSQNSAISAREARLVALDVGSDVVDPSGGRSLAVWAASTPSKRREIWVNTHSFAGHAESWGRVEPISPPLHELGGSPAVAVGRAGEATVVWLDYSSATGLQLLARSYDAEARTWSGLVPGPDRLGSPNDLTLVPGGYARVLALWTAFDADAGQRVLMAAGFDVHRSRWSRAFRIDEARGYDSTLLSVSSSSYGEVLVAWREASRNGDTQYNRLETCYMAAWDVHCRFRHNIVGTGPGTVGEIGPVTIDFIAGGHAWLGYAAEKSVGSDDLLPAGLSTRFDWFVP